MLHYHRAHRVVRDQTPETATVAIQTGTGLLDHLVGPITLLRCPLHHPAHLTVQIILPVCGRNSGVHHATSIILRRDNHVVTPVGQLFDLKLGRQLPGIVQARSSSLVEAVKATPCGQTDAATHNVYSHWK